MRCFIKQTNLTLEQLNKFFEEQLKINRKNKYGASSEKMDYLATQLSFFDEAENNISKNPIVEEPTEETITYKRKKKKSKRLEVRLLGLPVETKEYFLTDKTCPKCENPLHVMKKKVRKELKIILAQVKVIEHITYVYSCRNCEQTNISATIIKPDSPKALIAL